MLERSEASIVMFLFLCHSRVGGNPFLYADLLSARTERQIALDRLALWLVKVPQIAGLRLQVYSLDKLAFY